MNRKKICRPSSPLATVSVSTEVATLRLLLATSGELATTLAALSLSMKTQLPTSLRLTQILRLGGLRRGSELAMLRRSAMTEAKPSRRSVLLALHAAMLTVGCAKKSPVVRALRVAAAADVEPVFSALAESFRQKYGREVVLSFAASGALAKQIEHGAPFDLFASASQAHIDRLHKKGRLVPGSIREYARGQLAIWTTEDRPLPQSLQELSQSPSLRVSIANPEHAPYGQAAEAALRTLGVFDALKRRLIYAENVRQAQQFAESGNADVAIIARSLAGRLGRFVEVPISLHPPIVQTLAVLSGGDEAAASAFAGELFQREGRRLLRDSGFLPPASP